MQRLTLLKDVLAPRVVKTGQKLSDLPLTSEDWGMVWAAYEGFSLIVQHIAKRVIERELARKAHEESLATLEELAQSAGGRAAT
jgi:hypothetical protein